MGRMALSITLRVLFTFFQYLEYAECSFSIISGTFGSIFFLATRFHRAHVFIGTSFLVASFFRGFLGSSHQVLVLWVCWLVFGIDILLMLFESFFIFSSMHLTTPSFVSFLVVQYFYFLVSLNKDAMIYKFGANFIFSRVSFLIF